MLVEHELELCRLSFEQGLAAGPAADDVQEDVDVTEPGGDGRCGCLRRCRIEQVHG